MTRSDGDPDVSITVCPDGPLLVRGVSELETVDGETVTSAAADLESVSVTAEVLGATKGPKIHIHKFKNKTGYHKRQGHRQPLTSVVVRDISKG